MVNPIILAISDRSNPFSGIGGSGLLGVTDDVDGSGFGSWAFNTVNSS
ncbi:MAG: hypothetical protein RB292_00870 [Patescibacteria group bacterium]|nr:hypothetical protein [Patescibacteria group bacterium]